MKHKKVKTTILLLLLVINIFIIVYYGYIVPIRKMSIDGDHSIYMYFWIVFIYTSIYFTIFKIVKLLIKVIKPYINLIIKKNKDMEQLTEGWYKVKFGGKWTCAYYKLSILNWTLGGDFKHDLDLDEIGDKIEFEN